MSAEESGAHGRRELRQVHVEKLRAAGAGAGDHADGEGASGRVFLDGPAGDFARLARAATRNHRALHRPWRRRCSARHVRNEIAPPDNSDELAFRIDHRKHVVER